MGNKELVEICGILIHETADAIMIVEEKSFDAVKYWIPKSQIEDWEDYVKEDGDSLEFEIPEWLATEKGLV